MKIPTLIRIVSPKSPSNWLVLVVFVFMFCVAIGPRLLGPKGLLLAMAFLASVVALVLVVPEHWCNWCECWPPFLRGLFLGLAAYAAMITLGNFGELYNFRVWLEWLTVWTTGAAPFTPGHATGLAAALHLILAQRYYLIFPSPDDLETVILGEVPISYEQALERSQELPEN